MSETRRYALDPWGVWHVVRATNKNVVTPICQRPEFEAKRLQDGAPNLSFFCYGCQYQLLAERDTQRKIESE